ncbi:MAG: Veg family protein [Lactobacillaceae bacterium]|nr:Veg family protein [Lactobacillaceae bacterium]
MPNSIAEIKELLNSHIGQQVKVKVQAGRKRVKTLSGTLSKTYPAIFIVHLNGEGDDLQRVSYTYADLLTHNVSLIFE